MVGGIIILIIFFVMKDTPEFADEMFWIFSGAELVILSLASVGCIGGFIQVKYLKISSSFLEIKVEKILKDSLDLIQSPSVKI